MKKLIPLIILFSFMDKSNSQTWIKKGATWHFNYVRFNSTGFYKVYYEKDTVIENTECEKLVTLQYDFSVNQNYELYLQSVNKLKDNFTYISGDTLYYYVNNNFEILYNFDAEVGDTWDLGIDTNESGCSKSIVTVDSVGVMNINNEQYRWLYLSSNGNSSVNIHGKVVERFGAIQGFLFPLEYRCDSTTDWGQSVSFICFQDEDFELYNVTNKDCEYLLGVKTIRKETNLMYPSITNGMLNIDIDNMVSMKIYSIDGKELYSSNNLQRQLNIGNFKDGLYICVILDKNNEMKIQKIMKK